MAENSGITWTDHTFNPWWGCQKVAPGCTNCYAEAFSKRTGRAEWGPRGTRVKTSDATWREPIKWNRQAEREGKRFRVFCASMADVFEDWDGLFRDHKGVVLQECCNCEALLSLDLEQSIPNEWWLENPCCSNPNYLELGQVSLRRRLFDLIDATPQLDWLLLTKRPQNILGMWQGVLTPGNGVFRPNVWLGCSVSDQATADRNIPELLKCRGLAPVLFISAEPILEPINLSVAWEGEPTRPTLQLDWIIVGAESGHGRRETPLEAITGVVDQCQKAGVPAFVKQDTALHPGQQGRIPDEYWSVKQFPEVAP